MPPPPSTTKKVTARTRGAVAGNASRKQPSATDTTDRHSLRSILVASVYRLVLLGAVGAVVLAAWMPDHPLVAPYVAFFTSNATRAQTPMSTGAITGPQLVPLADALASTQRFPCGGLRLVQQDGVLMVDMHQLRGAAIADVGAQTIPLSFVNDDFCDCADGSDEPLTSACATSATATFASPSPTPVQQQRFYCRGDSSTAVPLWKVMDGVDDCCDGSDEDRDGVRLRTAPVGDAAAKCAAVVAKRARAAAAEARRLASGHRQFQQRAVYGSTKFGPAFVANVTKESAALDAAFADFQQKVGVLNERIRRSQQSRGQGHFQQEEDGGNVFGDVAEEEAPTVDPAEIAQAQQWNQYFTQRRGELGTKQAVLHHKALGQYFEYFPLFGKCFNFIIHEKQLKGGTAIPEQYNVTFRVCPFMYVLQRTETPEVVAAAARIATGSQQQQQQQQQQGATTTEDGATGDAATWRQDGETSRFIVAGYWTGQLANQFNNITSINILEPLRRGDAPEAAAGDVWVSQFTHGEACWNGPARSAALVFQCDTDDRVRTVVENGMCRYEILFGTPSACNDAVMAAAGGSGGGRDARPV